MICLREPIVRGNFQTFLFSLGRRALYRDTCTSYSKIKKLKLKYLEFFFYSRNDIAKTKSLKLLGRSE